MPRAVGLFNEYTLGLNVPFIRARWEFLRQYELQRVYFRRNYVFCFLPRFNCEIYTIIRHFKSMKHKLNNSLINMNFIFLTFLFLVKIDIYLIFMIKPKRSNKIMNSESFASI